MVQDKLEFMEDSMARVIEPKDTTREQAYNLWMKAPNPMVTFFKTLDVTNLLKVSKKKNLKFNMLLNYCIGKAAVNIKEFYILPVGEKLIQYDIIAVNTIVKNKCGEVNSCDILYNPNLESIGPKYLELSSLSFKAVTTPKNLNPVSNSNCLTSFSLKTDLFKITFFSLIFLKQLLSNITALLIINVEDSIK